jgi:hypothetical protein
MDGALKCKGAPLRLKAPSIPTNYNASLSPAPGFLLADRPISHYALGKYTPPPSITPEPSRRGVRHAPPGVSVEVEYVVLLRPNPFSSPATPGWTVVETKLGRERWQTDRFIYTKRVSCDG